MLKAAVTQPESSTSMTMEEFLISIEKRAYKMIELSVRDPGEAMDILQECMIKLVTHYQEHDCTQWKPIFYKMLQNKIRDWHRHQKVKNVLFFWRGEQDNTEVHWDSSRTEYRGELKTPTEQIEKDQQQADVLRALSELSVKQQQCFILRSWEGLSVAETASIMGCSEGSVKTHYFRAVSKIKQMLEFAHDYTIK